MKKELSKEKIWICCDFLNVNLISIHKIEEFKEIRANIKVI